jgi:hypothetical protein
VRAEAPPRPTTTVERPAARSAPPRNAPAQPSAPATTTAASVGGDLRNQWNQFVNAVNERDRMTAALLRSCSLIGLETGVLRLSTRDFIFEKLNVEATREMVESILADVVGHPCVIKYDVTSSSKRGRTARADDIPEDGMVATALDLGGEIVE